MKKTTSLVVAVAIAACNLFAQENTYMEMKITSTKGTTGNIKVYFSQSGHRMEFDMSMPQIPNGAMHRVSIIKKNNPDSLITIDDANKNYSVMDITPKSTTDNSTYTVTKVGEETVDGYKCIHSVVTGSHKENYDVWTSKDVPFYEQYNKISQSNPKIGSSARYKAMKDAGVDGFPVKTVIKNKDVEITTELVKIEKRDIPASMFEIPTGYTQSTSPSGMMKPADIMKMTPEERTKYIEDMKKMYGGGQ